MGEITQEKTILSMGLSVVKVEEKDRNCLGAEIWPQQQGLECQDKTFFFFHSGQWGKI